MCEVGLDLVVANEDGGAVRCTNTCPSILIQCTVLVDSSPVLNSLAQHTMILILKTCVVLNNSVASNPSLGRCPNPALVIQLASIHYHIRLVRHTVNTYLTKAYFIALYLRPTAFADLDPRTLNIIYFYSKH